MEELSELCGDNLVMCAKAIKELGAHSLSTKKIHRFLSCGSWGRFSNEIETILDMPYLEFKRWFDNAYEPDTMTHKVKICVEDEFREVFGDNKENKVICINGLYYAKTDRLIEITKELFCYVKKSKQLTFWDF